MFLYRNDYIFHNTLNIGFDQLIIGYLESLANNSQKYSFARNEEEPYLLVPNPFLVQIECVKCLRLKFQEEHIENPNVHLLTLNIQGMV